MGGDKRVYDIYLFEAAPFRHPTNNLVNLAFGHQLSLSGLTSLRVRYLGSLAAQFAAEVKIQSACDGSSIVTFHSLKQHRLPPPVRLAWQRMRVFVL